MANNTKTTVRLLSILSDGKLKDGTPVAVVQDNDLLLHQAHPIVYSTKAPSNLLLIRTTNGVYIPLLFHDRQEHNRGITWFFTNPLPTAEGMLFTINDHNYKNLFEFNHVFQLSGREPNLTQQNDLSYPTYSGNETEKERRKQVLQNLSNKSPPMTPEQFNKALNVRIPYVRTRHALPQDFSKLSRINQPPNLNLPTAPPVLRRTGLGDYANPSAKNVFTKNGGRIKKTRRAKKSRRTTRR